MSKRLTVLSVILSSIMLQGCLQEKEGERIAMEPDAEIQLRMDCQRMNEISDIKELLNQIHLKSNLALKLSSEPDPTQHLKEIDILGAEIHKYALQVESLLKPDWTDSKWQYQARWSITNHDLATAHIGKLLKVKNIKIQNVVLEGVARPDLMNAVRVKANSNIIEIGILKTANSLEICQMQKTFVIVLSVQYRVLLKDFTKYFKLTLQPKDY